MECNEEKSSSFDIKQCTNIKSILMLLVLIYHSTIFWSGTWFTKNPFFQAPILSYFAQWTNTFHIYTFTLVSGYIFYYLKKECNKYNNFYDFLYKKFKRLIVPYIFVSIVWVIPIQTFFFKLSLKDIANNFLFGKNPNQLWFLLCLFDLFIIFFIIWDIFERKNLVIFVSAIGVYYIGYYLSHRYTNTNFFCIYDACRHAILFYSGMMLRKKYKNKIIGFIKLIPLYFLFLIFNLKTSNLNSDIGRWMHVSAQMLCFVIGAITAFAILQKITKNISFKQKLFSFFGRTSMGIYLFHQQIIYFVIWGFNGKINPYINAGLNIVISLFASVFICSLLLRFSTFRHLIGEK